MSNPIKPKQLCGTCAGWKLRDWMGEKFVYQCRTRKSPKYLQHTKGEETCKHWRILRELTVAKW